MMAVTLRPPGSVLLSCCDRSGITPDWFPTQRVLGKVKPANCHQCSLWQTLTHAAYVQTQPAGPASFSCEVRLQEEKKKTNACRSLEAMSSCMQFLAWRRAQGYQPAAVHALGFHVETPSLHKRGGEWNMIYMARRKPTFKSDRKKNRTCHSLAMRQASWKCLERIAGSVHQGISRLCFWRAVSRGDCDCVCVALSHEQSHLIYALTFWRLALATYWPANVMERGIVSLQIGINDTLGIFNLFISPSVCVYMETGGELL